MWLPVVFYRQSKEVPYLTEILFTYVSTVYRALCFNSPVITYDGQSY